MMEVFSMKLVVGILIAAAVGAGCRLFDIPAPAPPKLLGASLVVAMTLGYVLADRYMERNKPASGAPTQITSSETPQK